MSGYSNKFRYALHAIYGETFGQCTICRVGEYDLGGTRDICYLCIADCPEGKYKHIGLGVLSPLIEICL